MRDPIRRFRLLAVTLAAASLALVALRAWGGRTSRAALGDPNRRNEAVVDSTAGLLVGERATIAPVLPPQQAPPSEVQGPWMPGLGSPIRLYPPQTWESWAPTKESLVRWYSSVPEFEGFDAEQWDVAWVLPEFRAAWATIREHQALRLFILTYGKREQARWDQHRASIALEDEIQPARGFFDAQFGPDGELWDAISSFSGEVVDRLRAHGEDADMRDSPAFKEDVRTLLTDHSIAPFNSGSPFETVARVLRGLRPR